jgi:hypothetical protein
MPGNPDLNYASNFYFWRVCLRAHIYEKKFQSLFPVLKLKIEFYLTHLSWISRSSTESSSENFLASDSFIHASFARPITTLRTPPCACPQKNRWSNATIPVNGMVRLFFPPVSHQPPLDHSLNNLPQSLIFISQSSHPCPCYLHPRLRALEIKGSLLWSTIGGLRNWVAPHQLSTWSHRAFID